MAKLNGIELAGNMIPVKLNLAPPPITREGAGKPKVFDFEGIELGGFCLIPVGKQDQAKNAVSTYNHLHSVPNTRGEMRKTKGGGETLKRDPIQKLVMRPLGIEHIKAIDAEALKLAAPEAMASAMVPEDLPQLYGVWRVL